MMFERLDNAAKQWIGQFKSKSMNTGYAESKSQQMMRKYSLKLQETCPRFY